jgi:hypothetical protein
MRHCRSDDEGLILPTLSSRLTGGSAVWRYNRTVTVAERPVMRFVLTLAPRRRAAPCERVSEHRAFARWKVPRVRCRRRWQSTNFPARARQSRAGPSPAPRGVQDPSSPPDGQWLGFDAAGVVRKVPVTGGTPMSIGDWRNGSALSAEIVKNRWRSTKTRVISDGSKAQLRRDLTPVR